MDVDRSGDGGGDAADEHGAVLTDEVPGVLTTATVLRAVKCVLLLLRVGHLPALCRVSLTRCVTMTECGGRQPARWQKTCTGKN